MGDLAASALERAPDLPEWIEPVSPARKLGWLAYVPCAHSPRARRWGGAQKRLAYDEIFANQLALMLLAPVATAASDDSACPEQVS